MIDQKDVWYLCRKYRFEPAIGVLCGWDWVWEHKDDVVPPPHMEIKIIKPEER